MAKFADYDVAIAMRDVIVKFAEQTVNRMRPDTLVGEVYDFNYGRRTADIRLRGHEDTELLQVVFSEGMVPLSSVLNPAESLLPDIVRVAGRPGSYYICDFIRGYPRNMRYELGICPPGTIIGYAGSMSSGSLDLGWGFCLGQFEQIQDYPVLFSKIGHRFNRDPSTSEIIDPGDGTFRFPDGRRRMFIGASEGIPGLLDLGTNEGDSDLDLRLARLSHLHTHTISEHPETATWNTPNTGTNLVPKQVALVGHDHTGVTGENSGISRGTAHPFQAINYIIKL